MTVQTFFFLLAGFHCASVNLSSDDHFANNIRFSTKSLRTKW